MTELRPTGRKVRHLIVVRKTRGVYRYSHRTEITVVTRIIVVIGRSVGFYRNATVCNRRKCIRIEIAAPRNSAAVRKRVCDVTATCADVTAREFNKWGNKNSIRCTFCSSVDIFCRNKL